MIKYLNYDVLSYVWNKIKSKIYLKTEVDFFRTEDGGNHDADLITLSTGLYSTSVAASTNASGTIYYDTTSCIGIVTTSSAFDSTTYKTIGVLPSGYRPSSDTIEYDSNGNYIMIATNGVVWLKAGSSIASGTAIYFYVEW